MGWQKARARKPQSVLPKKLTLRAVAKIASVGTSRSQCRSCAPISLPSGRRLTMAEEVAVFAGGCFWCTEAVFLDVVGVKSVESGYTGGHVPNPSYKQVCGGDTGHAEAIRVTYDPAVISYAEILDGFLGTHDPTQLNRQGNDVGTQYRSAIFPLGESQFAEAQAAIGRWNADHPGQHAVT